MTLTTFYTKKNTCLRFGLYIQIQVSCVILRRTQYCCFSQRLTIAYTYNIGMTKIKNALYIYKKIEYIVCAWVCFYLYIQYIHYTNSLYVSQMNIPFKKLIKNTTTYV